MKMKTALTIAGSDCSGGAGIQADLKTMTMNGVYAMSVITALTAQNTMGVRAIMESTPAFLGQQLDVIFEDIYPDAIKIGMTASSELIWFKAKRIDNPNTHGTGCTLSSAIASNLAKGFNLVESIQRAKEYVSQALEWMLELGNGSGPMNHAFDLKSKFSVDN